MFRKKKTQQEVREEEKQEKYLEELENTNELICPYCENKLNDKSSLVLLFIRGTDTHLIGCPNCKKVLGGVFF